MKEIVDHASLENFDKALSSLERVVILPNVHERDRESLFFRFILAYECFFPLVQKFVDELSGESAFSWRQTMAKAQTYGWLEDANFWNAMRKDRNKLVHVYEADTAAAIVPKILLYAAALRRLYNALNDENLTRKS